MAPGSAFAPGAFLRGLPAVAGETACMKSAAMASASAGPMFFADPAAGIAMAIRRGNSLFIMCKKEG